MDGRRLTLFTPGDSEWITGMGRVALAVIYKGRKKEVGCFAVEIGWVFKDMITLANYPVCMILRISVWNAMATNEIRNFLGLQTSEDREFNSFCHVVYNAKTISETSGISSSPSLKHFCDINIKQRARAGSAVLVNTF